MQLPRLISSLSLVTLILFLTLCGCGKKGQLIAPEAMAPAPIADLAVAQKGNHFQVSWSIPNKQEGGAALHDLAGFILFRRLPLPPEQDCEECLGAYRQLSRIDLDYLVQARRLGNRILFDDYDLKVDQAYQYKVRSFTADGVQSIDSNKARRTALPPPLPPVLEALSTGNSVVLSYVALPPEQGKLAGYNIYRAKIGDALPQLPLNSAPVTTNVYEDKQLLLGTRYSYSVTAVAVYPKGELIESAASNPAEGAIVEPD